MTWLQIVVLAVVQGLTEFLPVSSSGHLVLVPHVLGWDDQGLAFDVAVHFGSLIAVAIYFWADLIGLVRGGLSVLATRRVDSLQSRLALGIALGTIPAALAGLLLGDWVETSLRDPSVVVVTLTVFGVLMAAADRWAPRERNIANFRIVDALLIGIAQAMALVPGTSRSGVTITAGRILGFARQDAARFSFLLSAPVILLATGYKMLGLVLSDAAVPWLELAVAALVSAAVAYVCIDLMMRFVSRIGLLPFALYRLALAGVIVYVVL